ncbi:unnamed protein product, partial [Tetraodon nigroviridis]
KKTKKKGKTLTLTDFLAEDSGGSNVAPNYSNKSTSWADETDDLDGDVSTSWHSEEDNFRAPPIDRSILPTAPRSAREPNIDLSRLPRNPPYTAFLGNLPYDVTEDSIKDFFRGLAISAVRLPREPSHPERLKGFGYAEFDDVESLLRALSLSEENLGSRRIRVDIADQSNDKERDSGLMGGRDRGGRMSDMGPDKTDTDWRARPSADTDDSHHRKDDAFGERSRDRYESDRYRDGPRRDNDRYDGGRDRYRDRYDDRDRRDYDRSGYDSRSGGGRRAFGSGFRRDYDDSRGSGDRYGDRDRYSDRDRYNDRDDRYERRDDRREERGSRCRDGERSGENEVFSGREGEPSSPGTSPIPPSSSSSKEPLKVMPAPPPKENAWAKRSAATTGSCDGEGRPPVSPVSPSSSIPPKPSSVSGDERGSGKDENKADCVRRDRGPPKARGGPTGPGAGRGRGEGPNRDRRKEADRKDNRRDRDSKPPPEPKKFEETPTPVSLLCASFAQSLMSPKNPLVPNNKEPLPPEL